MANRRAILEAQAWLLIQGTGGQQLRILTPATRQMFNLHRRPLQGFAVAICFTSASSGFVPDASVEGRCENPLLTGGGDDGPDCVFQVLFRVLSAYVEDLFVIAICWMVLHVTCTPPLSNKAGI